MAASQSRKRAYWAGALVLLAGGMAAAAVQVSRPPPELTARNGGALAAPGLSAPEATPRKIRIITASGGYTLARTQREGWVLEERGGYPAPEAAVAAVLRQTAALRLERALTRDPAKLDRLRLGDPERGGRGVALQVQDERGAFLADLVLGYEPQGLYVRQRGSNQAWFAGGAMPELAKPAIWIESPQALRGASFVRLDVQPFDGPAFSLVRNTAGQLVFAPPWQLRRLSGRAAAQAIWDTLQGFDPMDVASAAAITAPVRGRLYATAADGLVIRADVHLQEEGAWLMVSASITGEGEPLPDVQARAAEINQAFGPWAFRIPDVEAAALLPAFNALTDQPMPKPAQATPAPTPARAAQPG